MLSVSVTLALVALATAAGPPQCILTRHSGVTYDTHQMVAKHKVDDGTACCTLVLLADFGGAATAMDRRKVLRICRAAGGLGGGSQQHGEGAPGRVRRRAAIGPSGGQ